MQIISSHLNATNRSFVDGWVEDSHKSHASVIIQRGVMPCVAPYASILQYTQNGNQSDLQPTATKNAVSSYNTTPFVILEKKKKKKKQSICHEVANQVNRLENIASSSSCNLCGACPTIHQRRFIHAHPRTPD